ncbi:hypothetical protein ALC60_00756 [Trachymyrmex zeteki]|uniref:Mutator-like transposase domain-containing protein n=1 Tax=Mycetomoellerius zeteki TaxID=64791 RepID=A0A151XJ99_9HYME|nr:hypothetical protein ALC60_00756 [Trachymyrmex zeteki]
MEVDGIVEMFSRSETLHGLKYCQYIGDGDSKTFKDITVLKKECFDHVQKRMGTRLRTLINLHTFCTEANARCVKTAERAMSSYTKDARKSFKTSRKENDEVQTLM